MDLEPLFTATKWNIIKMLSKKPYSPLELARETNTSIANISQQLRLLEVAGLVSSKKVSTNKRGKSRVLYSLSKDQSYIIAFAKGFAEKKLVPLTARKRIITGIWFVEQESLHAPLEEFFLRIEPYLSGIALFGYNNEKQDIIIVSDDSAVKKRFDGTSLKGGSGAAGYSLTVKVLSSKSIKSAASSHVFYSVQTNEEVVQNSELQSKN